MITIKKYYTKHQFRISWNKFEKHEQYDYEYAKCTTIYFFGILVWKYLESEEYLDKL